MRSLLSLGCFLWLYAQAYGFQDSIPAPSSVLKITAVKVQEEQRKIDVELNALYQGRPASTRNFNATNLAVREVIGNDTMDLEIQNISDIGEGEPVSLLFLIDESGSMNAENKLDYAKEAVKQTVRRSNIQSGASFYLATFHDSISQIFPLTRENIDQVLEEHVPGTNNDTDLYRAIVEKVNQFKDFRGKRAIILLSDGADDTRRNPWYQDPAHQRISQDSVLRKVGSLDTDFAIFPVGLGKGADTAFLQALVDSTSNSSDLYSSSPTPDQLFTIFEDIILTIPSTKLVELYPNPKFPIYFGNRRNILIHWTVDNQTIQADRLYQAGAPRFPVNLSGIQRDAVYWIALFLFGILTLLIIFFALSLIFPILKKQEFQKKFVVPYKREGNRTKRDPVTNEPFEDGDLVVVKCKQMIALSTWEGLGSQCPNYPGCIDYLGCNGAGAKEHHDNFFSQAGIFKRFNWLFFGAVGGYLAWMLSTFYVLLEKRFMGGYQKGVTSLVKSLVGQQLEANDQFLGIARIIANETFVGLAIGFGLCLAVAVVEERGQSRKFSYARVGMRVLLGLIVAFSTFFLGAMLQQFVLPSIFLGELITWLIFGSLFGLILAVGSSVAPLRGMLGGVTASLLAFLVYFFGIEFFSSSSFAIDLLKLLSFIGLGAILGYIIVTVISRLEDFELEYLSPETFAGFVLPISKWLKSGMEISVGRSEKCYIKLKWEDHAVLDEHAKLSYSNHNVFIEPVGETLVNGVIIPENRKFQLEDRAIIRLGRNSETSFIYKVKGKKAKEVPVQKVSRQEMKKAAYDKKRDKPNIVIRRRN